MKMRILLLFSILFLIVIVLISLVSKPHSSKGTDFWVGYMDNQRIDMNGYPEFSIIISSEYQAQIKITIPKMDFKEISISLLPYEAKEIFLPINENYIDYYKKVIYYPSSSEKIDTFGIRITSDNPISLYSMHYRTYFSDATLVLPLEELGLEYSILAGRDYKSTPDASELILVGTANETKIEISPSVITRNQRPANIPFNITLNEGEVYQVKSTFDDYDPLDTSNPGLLDKPDLTATKIRVLNDKKIAVFSGSKTAATMIDYPDSHLWDQDYPIDSWGSIYIYIPFKNQGGDIVKILSIEDSTVIKFNCVVDTILNKGGYYEKRLNEPTFINANKKIAVAQLEKPVFFNDNGNGDPSFLILPPINYQCRKAIFISSDSSRVADLDSHYVNIITKTKDINELKLDNKKIGSFFTPLVSIPSYSYEQVNLNEGKHIIESNKGFYAYAYGCGYADSYTYHLGYDYWEDISFNKIHIPDTSAELSVNKFDIPIYIDINENELPYVLNELKIYLHFDRRTFYFNNLTHGEYSTLKEDSITYLAIELKNLTLTQKSQIITNLSGIPLLSRDNYTEIIIDSIHLNSDDNYFCDDLPFHNGSIRNVACVLFPIEIIPYKQSQMKIKPNPISDKLFAEIETSEHGNFICELYDISGRMLLYNNWMSEQNQNIKKHVFSFDINDFIPGVYLIVLKTPENVLTNTFIKIDM